MLQLNSEIGRASHYSLFSHFGGDYMADMVRVNTRIGADANAWLDEESNRTGVPKSTLIHLAIEQYIQQKEAFARMADIGQLVQAIERLETKIAKKG